MRNSILFLLLIFSTRSLCQDVPPAKICSTNEICVVSNLRLKLKSIESRTYRIPVVFHVFDSYAPESKLSVEKAQKAIDLLNANFNGKSRNISDVQYEFKDIIANVGLEFVLAKKDPFGNSIKGVTYHKQNLKGDNPGANSTMKSLVNWNIGSDIGGVQRYLQIWVTYNVNSDDNGSGWCYLPDYDKGGKWAGPVYNYKFLGDGSSPNDDILTHEIGHYLGLGHVFGSTYDSCGDDGIEDTPETRCYAWKCRKGDLCNDGNVNVENYMGYSGCTSMFTNGQKEVMLYWINDPARKNLWSEENLEFTGVGDVATAIGDLSKPVIEVYPNPSDGTFYIKGTNNFQLRMYDLSGRLVLQTTRKEFTYKNKGVYILEIESEGSVIRKKIVVRN